MAEETAENAKGLDRRDDPERLAVLETHMSILVVDVGEIKRAVLGYDGNPGIVSKLELNDEKWKTHDKWAWRKWTIFASMFLAVFSGFVWIGKAKIMEVLGI